MFGISRSLIITTDRYIFLSVITRNFNTIEMTVDPVTLVDSNIEAAGIVSAYDYEMKLSKANNSNTVVFNTAIPTELSTSSPLACEINDSVMTLKFIIYPRNDYQTTYIKITDINNSTDMFRLKATLLNEHYVVSVLDESKTLRYRIDNNSFKISDDNQYVYGELFIDPGYLLHFATEYEVYMSMGLEDESIYTDVTNTNNQVESFTGSFIVDKSKSTISSLLADRAYTNHKHTMNDILGFDDIAELKKQIEDLKALL